MTQISCAAFGGGAGVPNGGENSGHTTSLSKLREESSRKKLEVLQKPASPNGPLTAASDSPPQHPWQRSAQLHILCSSRKQPNCRPLQLSVHAGGAPPTQGPFGCCGRDSTSCSSSSVSTVRFFLLPLWELLVVLLIWTPHLPTSCADPSHWQQPLADLKTTPMPSGSFRRRCWPHGCAVAGPQGLR